MASLLRASVSGVMLAMVTHALASSGSWLDLGPAGAGGGAHSVVELDVSSIQEGLMGPEAVIRFSRTELQRSRASQPAYRSWTMLVLFRCDSAQLEPLAVSFFSGERGKGQELAAHTSLSSEGIPENVLSVLSPAIRRTLLRAACSRASVHSS